MSTQPSQATTWPRGWVLPVLIFLVFEEGHPPRFHPVFHHPIAIPTDWSDFWTNETLQEQLFLLRMPFTAALRSNGAHDDTDVTDLNATQQLASHKWHHNSATMYLGGGGHALMFGSNVDIRS
jgi:hypothetical protein